MGWVFTGRMSFLSPNYQCQSIEGTQDTNTNQWFDLVLSSSNTGLLVEGTLLVTPALSLNYQAMSGSQ